MSSSGNVITLSCHIFNQHLQLFLNTQITNLMNQSYKDWHSKMHSMRGGLIHIVAVLHLLITAVVTTESEYFYKFIRVVDPQNVLKIDWSGLLLHPCSSKLKGAVKCIVQASAITEIRLERLNLSGRIDGESLCKLQNLHVLSLADNFIRGIIPDSI